MGCGNSDNPNDTAYWDLDRFVEEVEQVRSALGLDKNNFYLDMRDNHDILIVSDEMGKSKPASLFFISKFGCLVESVKFYSESTINSLWDSIDILLTANPTLLLNHPKDKIVIKYGTLYNQDINVEHSITTLKELKTKITELHD